MKYSVQLIERFVSDYKLPIPIKNDEVLFMYYLGELEEDYKALSKYEKLSSLIKERFNDNPDEFLKYYHSTRNTIITDILSSEKYRAFNTMPMDKYGIKDKSNVSKNFYISDNINGTFTSVDLKKANFQALKYTGVLEDESYDSLVGKYTDLYYLKESKYTRQVIFGQLNPSRHITVERYMINEVRKIINKDDALICMSNDELIYTGELSIDKIPGFELNIEHFTLKGFNLVHNKQRKLFFRKDSEDKQKLMTVPVNFFPIVHKLLKGQPLNDFDRRLVYEGFDALLTGDYIIETL
jgi:hypothetical protein